MRNLPVYLLLFAFSLLALSQTGCSNEAQSAVPEEEEETKTVLPVEATQVIRGDIAAYFTSTASLEAEDEALVASKADGVVTHLYVEEGDYVRKGQALAQLDGERRKLELARSEASLQQLKREYERNEELFGKQLVSVDEYDRVKSQYEVQKAAHDLASLEVQYTTIRAPIAGVISQRNIKVGHTIGMNEPTFHISDFDPLLAIMHVPERELGKLRPGQQANVAVDALANETFTGAIKRISPVVDPQTGTFKVTVEVSDKKRLLKPGMFGRVQIVFDVHAQALLVPKEALIEEDEEVAVYVVRDSMAFRQLITKGYTDAAFAEVLEGLEEGQPIITAGQNNMRDSTLVEIIEQ